MDVRRELHVAASRARSKVAHGAPHATLFSALPYQINLRSMLLLSQLHRQRIRILPNDEASGFATPPPRSPVDPLPAIRLTCPSEDEVETCLLRTGTLLLLSVCDRPGGIVRDSIVILLFS